MPDFNNPDDAPDNWELVHDSAMTNTTPGSEVVVHINTDRICENMSNSEFRTEFMKARDIGIEIVEERYQSIMRWDEKEKERARLWLARDDDEVRTFIQRGLPALLQAMRDLKPANIIRWDEQKQRHITCTSPPLKEGTDADVCKPDSFRRIIAIHSHFCTLPFSDRNHNSKTLTIMHECTHFIDVYDSNDDAYSNGNAIARWAHLHPEKAFKNADNIVSFIAYRDTSQ